MNELTPTDDGRCGSPLDDTLLSLAEGAMDVLSELTGRSCFCEDEDNLCEHCIATEAVKRIERLAYPVVRSSVSERRLSGSERVFFDQWVHVNKRVPILNSGCGTLELLMSDDPNEHRAPITQRDMDVATAVVQWLGTNCGDGFLRDCETEIKRRQDVERGDFGQLQSHNTPWKEFSAQPKSQQLAKLIADKYASTEHGRRHLENEILTLVQFAVQSELAEGIAHAN